MGNQSGKYFEETHQLHHARFDLRALMQTTDGAFEKCIIPSFHEASNPTSLTEEERRCSLEYIRTRHAYHKHFRIMFEHKLRESYAAKEKAQKEKQASAVH